MDRTCPRCQKALTFGRPKPGTHGLRCQYCRAELRLKVPDDERLAMVVIDPANRAERPSEARAGFPSDGHETAVLPLGARSIGETPPTKTPHLREPSASGPPMNAETIAATGVAVHGEDQVGVTLGAGQGGRALADERSSREFLVPRTLGGYRLLDELGRGGMGAVYRARQVSLDRDVALKVMSPRVSRSPLIMARFCREAYAAAQLVHHNVAQIYDFGVDQGTHYFSMEFVDGKSLAQLLKERGRLRPEEAAGLVLQAARGLKEAHDRGLVHRDIKPENLMLNAHGIVKVTDLGLVKAVAAPCENRPTSGGALPEGAGRGGVGLAEKSKLERMHADRESLEAHMTRLDIAMGTPAYMAPEQARNAARVDQRADIYALGCTLYTLVTGRPLFEGKSAIEVITKHATEPVVPPEVIIQSTPDALSALILKMVAKKPEDRLSSMDAVISELEAFLRVSTEQGLLTRLEEASRLRDMVDALGRKGTQNARKVGLVLLGVVCALGVVGSLSAGHPRLAGVILGVGLLTPLVYLLFGEVLGESELWRRARQCVFESRTNERIAVGAAALGLLAVLWTMGMLWVVMGIITSALTLAWPARLLIEGTRADQEPVARVQEVIKDMRIRGFDEAVIRRLVAERVGDQWGKVRDRLFGSEERLAAFQTRGREEWDRARLGLAAWRDAAVRWFEARVRARHDQKVKQHLQRVEAESLAAQGMSLDAAYKQARKAAEAVMLQAEQLRQAGWRATQAVGAAITSEEERRKLMLSVHEAAEKPDRFLQSMERRLLARRSEESMDAIAGPRVRLIAGGVLIALFLIWVFQNGLRTADETSEPLWLPLVPPLLTGMFRDWNAAVAGVLLMLSALWSGWRISLVVIPAAFIMLAGSMFGVPGWLSLLLGLLHVAFGFVVGIRRASAEIRA